MRSRFAPSPTGQLHLGHAYSALVAAKAAENAGGEFLLRIEDLDESRVRAQYEAAIYTDLTWLGLSWQQPVLKQSMNASAYRTALQQLFHLEVIYACTCTRADIRAATSAPQEGAPLLGPDGLIYPGTCRHRDVPEDKAALRLNMTAALAYLPKVLAWQDRWLGPQTCATADLPDTIGDVVLWRREGQTAAYHLAVVVDDAAQGITDVVRGEDLAEATPIHLVLQHLLGLPIPTYHHHPLIRDDAGKRLAKRNDARSIASYREAGLAPGDIIDLLPALSFR
ncbi:MAG: tRNA glutamyl-Q(34) synthetase GluQRS [Shimia sp.]